MSALCIGVYRQVCASDCVLGLCVICTVCVCVCDCVLCEMHMLSACV